ncbi:unnamed protein product [Mytilus edulis]|uniref:Uncharacterized protein n=1 Tax=Mytilus edulis TaxID=6550 RepID=A0A8S3RTD4_MYTED|nr:unnamed protein product [Mytilus edulis]
MCSEEGQIIFNNGTFRDDRSCRCNFKKGFALNITTQHPCQCIPSKEDCSCYKKHCPTDYVLTPDYVCVHRNNRTYISSCPDISPKSSIKESDNKLKHKLNDDSHDNLYFSKSCSDILPSRFYRFRISAYINNSHKSKHSDEIDICVPGDVLHPEKFKAWGKWVQLSYNDQS